MIRYLLRCHEFWNLYIFNIVYLSYVYSLLERRFFITKFQC